MRDPIAPPRVVQVWQEPMAANAWDCAKTLSRAARDAEAERQYDNADELRRRAVHHAQRAADLEWLRRQVTDLEVACAEPRPSP